MAGWHHWLNGHESAWTLGVDDRQGGRACCDSWGRKESDTTERLNWTELKLRFLVEVSISNSQKLIEWIYREVGVYTRPEKHYDQFSIIKIYTISTQY